MNPSRHRRAQLKSPAKFNFLVISPQNPAINPSKRWNKPQALKKLLAVCLFLITNQALSINNEDANIYIPL